MGDTLGEVEQALQVVQEVLPLAVGAGSVFFPQLAVLAPYMPLFSVVVQAVDVAHKDMTSGASILTTIQDSIDAVIKHNTPGQPGVPALSATAPAPTTGPMAGSPTTPVPTVVMPAGSATQQPAT